MLSMVRFLSKLKELEDDFFVNKDDMKVGNFKPIYLELEQIFPTVSQEYRIKLDQDFQIIKEE